MIVTGYAPTVFGAPNVFAPAIATGWKPTKQKHLTEDHKDEEYRKRLLLQDEEDILFILKAFVTCQN